MALSTGFKQACPSCDALVPIRDPKLVGKKIDCPKCKYRFVVESPRARDKAPEDDEEPTSEEEVADVGPIEEVDDDEGGVYQIAKEAKKKKAAAAKAAAAKALPRQETPAEAGDDAAAAAAELERKKKEKAKKKKFAIGLALAVTGLVVLAFAAISLMGGGKEKPKSKYVPPPFSEAPTPTPKPTKITDPDKDKKPKVIDDSGESIAGPELTNLVPKDADQITHFYFKDLLGPLRSIALGRGPFADELLKKTLGVDILAVDDVIRAERYGKSPWTFTVVHSRKPLDADALKAALGLTPAKDSPINKQDYFQVGKHRPWLAELASVSFGAPGHTRPEPAALTPLFVRLHDRFTLVLSDQATLKSFLQVEGKWSGVTDPKIPYQTLRPELKKLLGRVEAGEEKEKILISSAADLGGNADPAAGPLRQLWDVTHLLRDTAPKTRLVANSLIKKQDRRFTYLSEVVCQSDSDAAELRGFLVDKGAAAVARFVNDVLKHKVDVPLAEGKEPPPEGAMADSRIRVERSRATISFTLDLTLGDEDYSRLTEELATMALGVKAEVDLTLGSRRHELAKAAGLELPQKGLKERGVAPGQWPPAAFPRPTAPRLGREPGQRISWMAGLLPYLGHNDLYQRIRFDASWRDPANWMAARTLVPEFIDPTYPLSARYAPYPEMPLDLAATHFVGIAGVGLDAADYFPDKTNELKRGIFAYDRSATLKEVQKGRGLSSTILMIQVPYDSPDNPVGVTPWIAGGGSTVRGVPETNSIAPFVLRKDRFGQDITHKDKNGKSVRGTYAVMADGSVRWISDKIGDNAFKAMCTVNDTLPKTFDFDKSDLTEVIPPPLAEKEPPPPVEKKASPKK